MIFKPTSLIQVAAKDPVTGAIPASIPVTGYLTPPQIATAYNIPLGTGAGVKIGILSFGGGFLQSDLNSSFADLRSAGLIDSSVATPIISQVLLDGASGSFASNLNYSGENTVDIFCAATMAPAASITIYIGNTWSSPINQAIADGCDILTISWATSESTFLESLLATAATNKIAVCVASGDWGSTFYGSSSLQPCYPSSSANTISIGGTKLKLNTNNTRQLETDDNRDLMFPIGWGGGGGVSHLIGLPSWQSGLHYTPIISNIIGSPTSLTMRGTPDISAPMNAYTLYFNGSVSAFGGTSLSSPVVAGILARMQQITGVKRSSAEYNQIFYSNKTAFHDITVGSNNTTITSGYAGTVDWDPVTGLGPPEGIPFLASLLPTSPPTVILDIPSRSVTINQLVSPFRPVTASGGYGTLTYSISPTLPTGLSFNSTNGEITGTPTVLYSLSSFTITVTDSANRGSSQTISLAVIPLPIIANLLIPGRSVTINQLVSPFRPVTASGGYGTLIYSISPTLPTGLSFNSTNGEITGTPTVLRSLGSFTITVTDSLSQVVDKTLNLEVLPVPITTTLVIPSRSVLRDLLITPFRPVTASGGYGTLTYSISPTLPTGLSFNSTNGEITGTPTVLYSLSLFTITVTDSVSQTSSNSFTVKVISSRLTWITPAGLLFTATEAVSTSTVVEAVGIASTSIYTLISGSLPIGLELASDGTISGVPDYVLNLTSSEFVIRATNSNVIADRTFSIDVVGEDPPEWVTPIGYLPIGVYGENYAMNNQWVDYQLQATTVEAPGSSKLKYYIANNAGKLPPKLSLDQTGRITGFIRDKLVPDGNISQVGGYDTDPYDVYNYDHDGSFIGSATDLTIAGFPKIYQFRVTASDGIARSTQTFKIVVTSLDILKYNVGSMPVGSIDTSTQISYVQPLQQLNSLDLGSVTVSNNVDLDLSIYDPDPLSGSVTYSLVTSDNRLQNLPNYLRLDTELGHLYGFIPYQPAYAETYQFAVTATKYNRNVQQSFTITNTFTVIVKGNIESTIEWISTSSLGTIVTGITSEVSVVATNTNSTYNIKYNLTDGELPSGLILERDGSLSGKASYGSTGTYTFTVLASDVYELGAISREFTLTVVEVDDKKYTEVYSKPFLSREQRQLYSDFITNEFTFDSSLIYRYFDKNFGVQNSIKVMLEFGIEQVDLEKYAEMLDHSFYRRRFYFGEVKTAIAKNLQGQSVYEIVYIDLIDNLINDAGTSVSSSITSNSQMYYPASITNMRERLEQIVLPDLSVISINEQNYPRFMLTPQGNDYNAPGYMRIVPLCYALPGMGGKIVSRIKLSNFDFNMINFEIDRLIVQNSKDNLEPKYLIFKRQSLGDTDIIDC